MNIEAARSCSKLEGAGRSGWLPSWPLLLGVLMFAQLARTGGDMLLADADTQWHIAVGQWILEHGRLPTTDHHSHTFAGRPWIAKEWLSQLILAVTYDAAGWKGVVVLTAAVAASTFALFLRLLQRHLAPLPAVLFTAAAAAVMAPHLFARPHVLALPLVLIWVDGLVRAVEDGRRPSLWLLPVMILWANLHGGFTLGLLLTAAFALEAIVARRQLLAGWAVFGAGALIAASLTPYGPESMLVTRRIFELGTALQLIAEWRSPDFQDQVVHEVVLLAGVFAALASGLKVPVVRLLIVVGLLHLYLRHARNAENLVTLVPLMLAPLLARRWPSLRPDGRRWITSALPSGRNALVVASAIVVGIAAASLRWGEARPPEAVSPSAALAYVRAAGIAGPVFNDYGYGGFLILQGVPTFIDGRGELYGRDFLQRFGDAVSLRGDGGLESLLDAHGVQWTLLQRDRPANRLLARLPNWRRAYEDETASVFVRQ
jgi:hypothetical protein